MHKHSEIVYVFVVVVFPADIKVMHAVYLPFPSLADTDRAGEDSLGLLAEGGPDSRTLSAIFLTN